MLLPLLRLYVWERVTSEEEDELYDEKKWSREEHLSLQDVTMVLMTFSHRIIFPYALFSLHAYDESLFSIPSYARNFLPFSLLHMKVPFLLFLFSPDTLSLDCLLLVCNKIPSPTPYTRDPHRILKGRREEKHKPLSRCTHGINYSQATAWMSWTLEFSLLTYGSRDTIANKQPHEDAMLFTCCWMLLLPFSLIVWQHKVSDTRFLIHCFRCTLLTLSLSAFASSNANAFHPKTGDRRVR